MALPYDLLVLEAGPALAAGDEELRRLANRLPLGLAAEDPKLLQEALTTLGVPVSWSRAGARNEACWSGLLEETGLRPERVLVAASSDAALIQSAAARGVVPAGFGPGPPSAGPVLRHRVSGLAGLRRELEALDREEPPDPAWAASPWPEDHHRAVRDFNRRRYYEAHEAWERLWKVGPPEDRAFYRGLIQLAVATLHWERGNDDGAELLAAEGRRCLIPYVPWHQGLDVLSFLRKMDEYFEPFHTARRRGRAAPAPDVAHPPQIRLEERP